MAFATTFDDLIGVSSDRFYTWDDPMMNARLDTAYASGSVTRDGPGVSVDWSGSGVVDDTLTTQIARDTFKRTAVGSGWGTSTQGQSWTAGTTNLSTDGTSGIISIGALSTIYFVTMPSLNAADFDYTFRFAPSAIPVGDKLTLYFLARFQDINNCIRFRVEFNANKVIRCYIDSYVGGVQTNLFAGAVPLAQVSGRGYYARVQGVGSVVRVKAWWNTDVQPSAWAGTGSDTVYAGVPGSVGAGAALGASATNTLPFRVYYDLFWSGLSQILDNGGISATLSLDDGMPQGATNTDNIGVGEAEGKLAAPIGSRPSVYYSQFRPDQPYSEVDRDVATIGLTSGVVASDGVRDIRLFTGQMTDTPITGDDVQVTAVSRNRLRLSTLVQPPAVHGFFEGGGVEATWAIGYALYKSGFNQFPPLIPGCRLYAPLNGGLHPYLPDTNSLVTSNAFPISGVEYTAVGSSRYKNISWVDGPFPGTAAPDVLVSKTRTVKVFNAQAASLQPGPGDDFWSQASNRVRIECWVKGSEFDAASSLDPTENRLLTVIIANPAVSRFVQLGIPNDTRVPFFFVNDGTSSVLARAWTALPMDNQWHFVGMSADVANNIYHIVIDNQTITYSGLSPSVANLPLIDDIDHITLKVNVPASDLRITTGALAGRAEIPWNKDMPWTRDVDARRSIIKWDGVAEPEPREAFEYIQSIAQAELARIGFDRYDKFQYLTAPYWAETNQQNVAETLSTALNLGTDFRPARPVNMVYNQVAVKYKSSKINETFQQVFQSSELIRIVPGFSSINVPLAPSAIEIRGASLSVLSGAALAATPPSATNAINYLTANTVEDGSGTYATAAQVKATVTRWDPGSATIQFVNNTGNTYIVSNNVSLPPIGLAAKVMVEVDASATSNNTQSQMARGTRYLSADLPMIKDQATAQAIANELVARLAWPRITVSSSVWGDPRRAPGQMVRVTDPDQSNINGIYRVTGVTNAQEGEDLQQTLSMEQGWGVMVWGQSLWGQAIWGDA